MATRATEVSAPPARMTLDVAESAPAETRVDNDVSVSTADDGQTIVASSRRSVDNPTTSSTSTTTTSSATATPGVADPRGTREAPTTMTTVTTVVVATIPAATMTIATSTTAAPATAPPTLAPVPTAAPTTVEATTPPVVSPVRTGGVGFYLGAAGPSADDFSLTNTPEPMGATESDHDGDGTPGLTIDKSDQKLTQTDGRKFQQWNLVVAEPIVLSGQVALELWSTTKNFHDKHDLDYSIWLLDCAPDGSDCMILASTVDVHVKEWNGGVTDWVHRMIPVGTVDHTVQQGRMLRLRLMFDHHEAWIALSGDRPSRLHITSATG